MIANFYGRIYERLLTSPSEVSIIWPDPTAGERTYTGNDILNRVTAIRNDLSGRKIQPGQSVLLLIPVSFDLICTLLAVMATGAIPVLPPAESSPKNLFSIITGGNIALVITQHAVLAPLSWVARWFRAGLYSLDRIPESVSTAWLPPIPVDADQPALTSHSSGSTGKPKSIRRSHRVLLAQHRALSEAFPPWPGQRDFPLFPNVLLHNLAAGTVSILPDLPGFNLTQMDPARIVRQLTGQRVDTLTGNVYYVQKLLNHLEIHPHTFPNVRAIGIGGSPVPELLVHSLAAYFPQADRYVIYGSSEAEPIAIRQVGATPCLPRAGYAVGTVHGSLQVRIHALGTLTFPDGKSYPAGEIEVKGAHVATSGNDWLQTGDFGYFDEQQQLFLTGRKGNERIHLGVQHYQIEHSLLHLAGVKRVAARPTETGFTIYVEGTAHEADLWQILSDNFPQGICHHIYFRSKLPVDARHHSKIRYDRVR